MSFLQKKKILSKFSQELEGRPIASLLSQNVGLLARFSSCLNYVPYDPS